MEANALFLGIKDKRGLWLEAIIRELHFAGLTYRAVPVPILLEVVPRVSLEVVD